MARQDDGPSSPPSSGPTTARRPAGLEAKASRSLDIVDSGLCTRTSAVPDWLARLDQLEHLKNAAGAADRRATLAILDDALVVDLLFFGPHHLRAAGRPR